MVIPGGGKVYPRLTGRRDVTYANERTRNISVQRTRKRRERVFVRAIANSCTILKRGRLIRISDEKRGLIAETQSAQPALRACPPCWLRCFPATFNEFPRLARFYRGLYITFVGLGEMGSSCVGVFRAISQR